jgi:hypothetical protein
VYDFCFIPPYSTFLIVEYLCKYFWRYSSVMNRIVAQCLRHVQICWCLCEPTLPLPNFFPRIRIKSCSSTCNYLSPVSHFFLFVWSLWIRMSTGHTASGAVSLLFSPIIFSVNTIHEYSQHSLHAVTLFFCFVRGMTVMFRLSTVSPAFPALTFSSTYIENVKIYSCTSLLNRKLLYLLYLIQ